jgi:exopolyphosphatase/guanosine-5'-triphosphate,3'-diphosphate pyrophosphatase
MYAAVDLGSNSFRLHVGKHDGATIRVVKSLREPIRLGAGIDKSGRLTAAAMDNALACLASFRAVLAGFPLDAVRVVGTAALRLAQNAEQFLPRAEAAIGQPIEIISGEEEGRLIYMGVANALALALPTERRLVIDIGGGSTEVILGRGLDIERVESFSVGTVRQSLSFFPAGRIDAHGFDAAILSARSQFEDAAPPYQQQFWRQAYGSSGTIRSLAEVIARNGVGDGRLTLASLQALKERFIALGDVARIDLPGLKSERASTVIGGLAILIAVMMELGVDVLIPVEAGLRMGVMWDLHARSMHLDRRDQSVRTMAAQFQADAARAGRVALQARALYAQLKPAGEQYQKLLEWSAQLHEIGMLVSHTGYHKHAAYIIENADLPGFTTREQKAMARLVVAQKGNLRKIGEPLQEPDFAKAVLALRLAIVLMHARIDADDPELALRLRMKQRIDLELGRGVLAHHPTLSYWIEKEREWWDEVNVDFSVKSGA